MKLLSERLERLSEKFGMAYDDADNMTEAAAALRAVEGAARGRVIVPYGDGVEFALADDRTMEFVNARALRNQLCALVPLDAAGSAEGVGGG